MSGDCLGFAVRRHRNRRVLVPGSVASSTSRLNAVRSKTVDTALLPAFARHTAGALDHARDGQERTNATTHLAGSLRWWLGNPVERCRLKRARPAWLEEQRRMRPG